MSNVCLCQHCKHTCQVGEVQKREVLREAILRHLIHQQHSNSRRNFENDEIFLPLNGLELFISCKNIVFFVFGGQFGDFAMRFHRKIQYHSLFLRRKL